MQLPRKFIRFLGGNAERVTPVPIPNTEVKPLRADGTALEAVWESRSPPGIFTCEQPLLSSWGCSLFSVRVGALNLLICSVILADHYMPQIFKKAAAEKK